MSTSSLRRISGVGLGLALGLALDVSLARAQDPVVAPEVIAPESTEAPAADAPDIPVPVEGPEPIITESEIPGESEPLLISPSQPEAGTVAPPKAEDAIAEKKEQTTASDFDPRIPPHAYIRPQWAFSLGASLKALGKIGGQTPKSVNLSYEYQPKWVQSVGVLGVGPTLTLFPTSGFGMTSVWGVGAIARYQARFFYGQWIVPTVAYFYDRISYRPSGQASGVTSQKGLVLGAFLLLNFLDSDTAAESYATTGIIRNYAFFEMRTPQGGDTNLGVQAKVYQWGLRFEF